jgi:hypothetical protein
MNDIVRMHNITAYATLEVRSILLHNGSTPKEIFSHRFIAIRKTDDTEFV